MSERGADNADTDLNNAPISGRYIVLFEAVSVQALKTKLERQTQVGSVVTAAVFKELRRRMPVITTKPPTTKIAMSAIFCFLGRLSW